jgi:hypothetical protein
LTGKRPFTDATVAEITAIHAAGGDDVIFQLEIPAGRPLEFVHAPFAAAEVVPPTAPRWYAPLDRLELRPGMRFIAGFAHEDQLFVLDLIERSVGERVAISHACGLGRRTPEAAERALERLAVLPRAAAERYAAV